MAKALVISSWGAEGGFHQGGDRGDKRHKEGWGEGNRGWEPGEDRLVSGSRAASSFGPGLSHQGLATTLLLLSQGPPVTLLEAKSTGLGVRGPGFWSAPAHH